MASSPTAELTVSRDVSRSLVEDSASLLPPTNLISAPPAPEAHSPPLPTATSRRQTVFEDLNDIAFPDWHEELSAPASRPTHLGRIARER